MNPLEALLNLVDLATATYISGTVANIVGIVNPIFRNLLILFFILYGIGIWRGAIQSSVQEFVFKMVTVSIVYAMVFSWSIYNQYIVNFLTNGPDALGGAIAGVGGGNTSQRISEIHGLCFNAMMNAFQGSGYVMKYLIGIIIFIASTVLITFAGALLVIPKIALSVLVAIGPLAFLMLLFKGTRRMFDAWLQQCINFFLYTVFTIMILTLLADIFQSSIAAIPESPGEIVMGSILPMVFTCFIMTVVLKQVPAISSAIAGGVQVTSLGAESIPGRLLGNIYSRWSHRRYSGGQRAPQNVVNAR